MEFQLKSKPDFACLTVTFANGEKIQTETGAMMGMSPALKMETNMQGGLFAAAKRALGGESLFQNTYTATADGQRLDIAPSAPGDLEHIKLDNSSVAVSKGGYVACTPGVTIDAKFGGFSSFKAGEGLVMLKCHGTGDLFISSFGAIHCQQVNGTYVVDTGHIVAFDDTLTFTVRSIGGVKSLFFSGEGRVCEFSGTGRVWFQTRAASTLAAFLHPFRRVKPKSN